MKTIICFLFLTFLTHSNSCDKKGIIKFCLKTNLKGFKDCVIEQEKECKKPTFQQTENTPTTAKPFQQISFEQNEDTFEQNEDKFEQNEETFEQNEDTFEQNEDLFEQNEDSFEQNEDWFEQNKETFEQTTTSQQKTDNLSIFNAIPVDGQCKNISIDYAKISKVCVTKKAIKFCLKSYANEIQKCLKSVKEGLCYKKCFVNITSCFNQIPIDIYSSRKQKLTNEPMISNSNIFLSSHFDLILFQIWLHF